MSGAEVDPPRPLDKRPFFWMLGILSCLELGVLGFRFAGEQKPTPPSGSASTR